jgi:hypothetical protein
MRFGLGFKEQRNDHHGQRAIFLAPGFELPEPAFANARVKDVFQLLAGGGIGENDLSQWLTAQAAVAGNNVAAKNRLDFPQGRLAGFDEPARQLVGVHDLRAVLAEKSGGSGFAHPNAAGQSQKLHQPDNKAWIYLRDEKLPHGICYWLREQWTFRRG